MALHNLGGAAQVVWAAMLWRYPACEHANNKPGVVGSGPACTLLNRRLCLLRLLRCRRRYTPAWRARRWRPPCGHLSRHSRAQRPQQRAASQTRGRSCQMPISLRSAPPAAAARRQARARAGRAPRQAALAVQGACAQRTSQPCQVGSGCVVADGGRCVGAEWVVWGPPSTRLQLLVRPCLSALPPSLIHTHSLLPSPPAGSSKSAKRRAAKKKSLAAVLGGGGEVRLLNAAAGGRPPLPPSDTFPALPTAGVPQRPASGGSGSGSSAAASRPGSAEPPSAAEGYVQLQRDDWESVLPKASKKALPRPPSVQEIAGPSPQLVQQQLRLAGRRQAHAEERAAADAGAPSPSHAAAAAAAASAGAAAGRPAGISEALRQANKILIDKIRSQLDAGQFAQFRCAAVGSAAVRSARESMQPQGLTCAAFRRPVQTRPPLWLTQLNC